MSAGDLERFRAVIAERLGMYVPDERLADLGPLLHARMESGGHGDLHAYLSRLRAPGAREELRALARELTVGETYFLRNAPQFEAFAAVVVPGLAQGRGRIRVLSAGCASGEEAYSLAILMRERCPEFAPLCRIHGIDVNVGAVEAATRARYSRWSLRDTPAEICARYFEASGRELVLADRVRAMVSFEERNLVEDAPAFWRPDAFDVVFCRNVIMYFSPEAARAVVARVTRSLSPGGYLFLGHVETLRGLSEDYDLCNTHETFYYRRRDAAIAGAAPTTAAPPASAPRETTAPADAWADVIRQSSDQIAMLAEGRRGDGAGPSAQRTEAPIGPSGHTGDFDAVIALMRRERFADALARLRALPPSSHDEPGAQLLLAVLLTNAGDRREAEAACRRLLARGERSAGAHYLIALCRERAGDVDAAIQHDRAAASLEPSFAMPRLHLGLMAKRARDLDVARAELGLAASLLTREEESRLLLFGGGFHRDALVELCRAELRAMRASGA